MQIVIEQRIIPQRLLNVAWEKDPDVLVTRVYSIIRPKQSPYFNTPEELEQWWLELSRRDKQDYVFWYKDKPSLLLYSHDTAVWAFSCYDVEHKWFYQHQRGEVVSTDEAYDWPLIHKKVKA